MVGVSRERQKTDEITGRLRRYDCVSRHHAAMKLLDLIHQLPGEFIDAVSVRPPVEPSEDEPEYAFETKLRVGLMFPMLNDAKRQLLIGAWHLHGNYTVFLNMSRQGLRSEDLVRIERTTNELEQQWMSLKARLEDLMRTTNLTAAQREFIQEELLTPVLPSE